MKKNPDSFWALSYPADNERAIDYFARIKKRETNPEPPLVPETFFWGIVGSTVVGRISVRHRLNDNLAKYGGHIGYEVHPDHRRRGYATEMLRLVLQTDVVKNIGKILLTCAPDNVASNKTILTNGGVFSQKIFVDFINADRNHYWIEVK